MPSSIITAGDAVNNTSTSGGNDGTLAIVVGANGAKVNGLVFDALGKPTLAKTPIFTDAPAFSAYQSTIINLGLNINTQIIFQTKEYDFTNSYNVTTGVFTAPVAGVYHLVGSFAVASTVTTLYARLYKNGGLYKETVCGQGATQQIACHANLVAGDTIAFYAQQATTAQNSVATAADTYFQAVLVRAT